MRVAASVLRACIVTDGNTVLVDYSQIPLFLFRTLPRRISDSVKDSKADVVEALVNRRLSGIKLFNSAYTPKKLFKLNKKRLGEADLSFRVGRVIIIIDVKAYAVFDAFDRGEFSAVRTRWGYVQAWLEQVDSLAQKLALEPKGDNYDLVADGYTHIFPLVCSASHEWIGSTDPYCYLTKDISRAAMPIELERYFGANGERAFVSHRCAVLIVDESRVSLA